MFDITEIHIQAKNKVASLCWHGDVLVDWVAGGHRYYLDGHIEPRNVAYRFTFDAAVISPSGDYTAIFVRRSTKGLLLHQGKIIRELNRSFYYAHAYEYPITLFRLQSGQEVIAHCPDHYNQLEIDDLATGKRLTNHNTRKPSDFFFSRLATTRDGSFLLSAGWHWHPVDHVKVFSIENALMDPSHLDGKGLEVDTWAENSSANFTEENRLIVALSDELYDGEEDEAEDDVQKKQKAEEPFGIFRIYDLSEVKLIWASYPQSEVGTIMPVGESHALGFFEYPKLFDLHTGAVIYSWPHLKSGKQRSSIIWGIEPVPPMAFDTRNLRFAIANETEITVVQLAHQHPK